SAIGEQDTDLEMKSVGWDGFAFVVNKANPVDSLTRQQAKGLACGEIANWKQVGGKDVPVTLYRRDEKNSAGEVIVKTFGCATGKPNKDPVGADIYKLTSNEGAFAYGGYVVMMGVQDKVKILALDGVLPSTEAIRNGKYWLKRPVYLVKTKKDP